MTSRWKKAAISGVLVGFLGVIVSPADITLAIDENIGLGLLFKLRGVRNPPREAVVVSIDRESSERLGVPDNPDKWPRSLHARLTEVLAREGARVVAFDVHFIEPRSPGDDLGFAGAMKRAGNTVLCEPIRTGEVSLGEGDASPFSSGHNIVKVVQPIDLFCDSALATAPFTLPRIPFKVSRYFTFDPGAGDSPSMPMVAFQLYAAPAYGDFVRLLEKAGPAHAGKLPKDFEAARGTRSVKDLMRKTREIFDGDPGLAGRMLDELERSDLEKTDAARHRLVASLVNMYRDSNNRYINFYGPPRTVPTVPYHKALEVREGGGAGGPKADLKGKAVFVGLSESLLAERKDSFYTVFSRANGIFIGGVEIAATAFANIAEDSPLRPLTTLHHLLLVFLWGALAGTLCRAAPIGTAAAGTAGLCAAYLAVAWHRFGADYVWHPIVVPLLFQAPLAFFGGVIWSHVDTKKEHDKIRKAFEYYLPKSVVDQLVKNLGEIGTAGQTVHGVCMFTDAEHYTSLSETMEPAELGAFMNRYYETLFKPVKTHGGVVSNVAGDSMLAIWAAATPGAVLREKACLAAIDIDRTVKEHYPISDPNRLGTRIGLHYGDLFLGNIGGEDRYQHSAMGDMVNTASRIEGLNKHLGTRVLASADVMSLLDGFLARDLGAFVLKGKSKPIGVHELICRAEDAGDGRNEACRVFAGAIDAFRRGSWDEAIARFGRCVELQGEDGPSRFYIGECERYRTVPPAEPWDGLVRMEKK